MASIGTCAIVSRLPHVAQHLLRPLGVGETSSGAPCAACRRSRRGFLGTDRAEANAVATVVEALALSRPHIGFFLRSEGQQVSGSSLRG